MIPLSGFRGVSDVKDRPVPIEEKEPLGIRLLVGLVYALCVVSALFLVKMVDYAVKGLDHDGLLLAAGSFALAVFANVAAYAAYSQRSWD